MNLLHVISSIDPQMGGVISGVLNISNEQSKYYSKVSFAVLSNSSNKQILFQKNIIDINFFKNTSFISIYFFLKKEKYDVVHIHGLWEIFLFKFFILSKLLNIKVIISPHGMLEPWSLLQRKTIKKFALFFYQKNCLNTANAVIATSELEKQNIAVNISNTNIYIVENAIDYDFLNNGHQNIINRKINSSKFHLLFLSRIHEKKGLENLFKAWSKIDYSIREPWTIIVAGDGDQAYLKKLVLLVNSLGIEKEVNFIGFVTGFEKLDLYTNCDLFILPSYSENFGNVIIEAMSSSLPVITTVGTPWKVINEINAGWCIEIGVEPIYSILNRVLLFSKPELYNFGINGRQFVLENYSPEIIHRKMNHIFKKL